MEKAAAEVTSAAGKSFVKVISRIANAWSAKASARMEAEAAEIKRDIAHTGALKRKKTTEEAARQKQLDDIEHAYALRQRAVGRFSADLTEEQLVIEHVIEGAARKIEVDPDNANPREPDPDWLRRFFNYVSQVDEETVLEVFMSALANAAISGRPIVPAKALDTLRFFTATSFQSFLEVAQLVLLFGHANEWQVEQTASGDKNEADIELLLELGLLKTTDSYHVSAQIGPFHVNVSYDTGTIYRFEALKLTQAGSAIVNLVDKDLSRLQSAMGNHQRSDEFEKLQKRFGVTPAKVTTLANGLIANIHDSTNVDIYIKYIDGGDAVVICDKERRTTDQPFGIRTEAFEGIPNSDSKAMFGNFIEVFDKFDRETLPAMQRRD
ncbi:DUF2806 domain-containing protein [Rhizobium sp. SL42]|uniref:DUF2806 domain-containing protein n=1 Tax=Rhizobium sp. SL42 TaxID=2806346 RepID=UPI001F1ED053|nr:DUF2806 domain-containing protein [Rhizobium sp. SL42]UJW77670.1 DUF2806 domain-containing protein [Rhizobium sp. SL42]